MKIEIKQRIEQIRLGNVPEGYQKTKDGIFPTDWHTQKMKQWVALAERPVTLEDDKRYRLVTVRRGFGGVDLRGEYLGKDILVKNYFKVRQGDFLISKRQIAHGACGVVSESLDGAVVSNEYNVFVQNQGTDIEMFDLMMQLPHYTRLFYLMSDGVHIEKLLFKTQDWMRRQLAMPSIEEQQRIAAILTTQDKVIELKEKRLAEKQRQKKYLMHRFFVDANGKKIRLGQIANIIMGQSPSSTSYNEQMKGMPLIQGNGDIEGRNTHPRMYTTQPTKICKKGDILISVRAPVGSVSRSSMNACIGRGMCAVDAGIYQNYVYQYLIYFEDKWGKVSQGSTFESISGDEIRKLKILIPDNMQHIEKILSTADHEIELFQKDIAQEKQKKKALMQLLLTGIVRVKT